MPGACVTHNKTFRIANDTFIGDYRAPNIEGRKKIMLSDNNNKDGAEVANLYIIILFVLERFFSP